VTAQLKSGEADGAPLSEGTRSAWFRGGMAIAGHVCVNGAPVLAFGCTDKGAYILEPGRTRGTALHCSDLKASNGTSVEGEGWVVRGEVVAEQTIAVDVRAAKKKELTRVQQERALLSAMEKQKYSSLLAQITKSKMRKVHADVINKAQQVLKSIERTEGTFLTHAYLKKKMKWKLVTTPADDSVVQVPCEASDDCPCNQPHAQDGEELTFTYGGVDAALSEAGLVGADRGNADEWLFKQLVKAAMAAPEGCVWKSGGKFILSNEERNQSANAIVALLERDPDCKGGAGIRALVDYTEREYNARVTAVQLNFHPNEKSSHKQHRDIYGAGQKGGINCTCSFMKCIGTVCYSLGSSRQILTETMTDERSKYEACGESCTGCKTYTYLHSGCNMFFNGKWNRNHTHGVPSTSEPSGPRISIALLLA
jgi:hypothetical protein